ncbi:MAG: hypothetical protein H6710_09380 [Myxococcales bacterium]|nr:hypothetical protein [Myxococcales bacterium]
MTIHLADAIWREASGQPLTMPHGQPRGPLQRAILEGLARRFAASGFSLRDLLVAVATHPLLDLDAPDACSAPLPPIFAPFADANHAGDLLRREEPWLLIDGAAIALGWPTMERFPLPHGWTDEELLRALGAFLDESEPGHRGLDVVAALAWEASVGAGVDPAGSARRPATATRT